MANVQSFIEKFKNDKVTNTKLAPNAIGDYLRKELDIKTYIPFRTKREIVEMVVAQNIEWVEGVKKIDAVNEYVSFVVAVISAHTNLEWSNDPVTDYDLLAESGLLPQIIAEFQESYSEFDIILKMVRASELEDNNVNVLVGKFLNGILERLDSVGEVLKNNLDDVNIKDILGNFNQEDLAKLTGFLNKYNN